MERRKESVRRTAARKAVFIEPETGGAGRQKRRGCAGPRRLARNGHAKPDRGAPAARVQMEIIPRFPPRKKFLKYVVNIFSDEKDAFKAISPHFVCEKGLEKIIIRSLIICGDEKGDRGVHNYGSM
jgi:hypothetical protein